MNKSLAARLSNLQQELLTRMVHCSDGYYINLVEMKMIGFPVRQVWEISCCPLTSMVLHIEWAVLNYKLAFSFWLVI